MTPLPRVTHDLPGVGGALRAEPSHFVVEELPLYEAAGEGEHVYLRLCREGRTTHELAHSLGTLFGLPPRAIGFAGRKDKHARATQTFSLHLHAGEPADLGARAAGELGVEVLEARRHGNKLRRGHLVGNRFTIRVTGIDAAGDPLARARAVAAALDERGLANFYGPQRFGADGANVARGRRLLERAAGRAGGGRGRRPRSDRDGLMLSAWQSELFNRWLAGRIRAGAFQELLEGDLAHKELTGGMFPVEDVDRERPRFVAREITYTGPMFGARMRRPTGRPDELEREVLAAGLAASASGPALDEAALARAGLEGSRRDGRIAPRALSVAREGDDLVLAFELPKGAYATTLLDEVMKSDTTAATDA